MSFAITSIGEKCRIHTQAIANKKTLLEERCPVQILAILEPGARGTDIDLRVPLENRPSLLEAAI